MWPAEIRACVAFESLTFNSSKGRQAARNVRHCATRGETLGAMIRRLNQLGSFDRWSKVMIYWASCRLRSPAFLIQTQFSFFLFFLLRYDRGTLQQMKQIITHHFKRHGGVGVCGVRKLCCSKSVDSRSIFRSLLACVLTRRSQPNTGAPTRRPGKVYS